ncbi:hypothetical protein Z042_11190 [Chania multitudinisentens RB-25]|uniref:Uncharacterized protein n=1 Tax=Chania multitudinisentens RB-25 TaxID=1441930 RepID=W0LK01_9GAMM|nr:hypothetical protein Z042_11190 [Chania multitudinisentens RB-25]
MPAYRPQEDVAGAASGFEYVHAEHHVRKDYQQTAIYNRAIFIESAIFFLRSKRVTLIYTER